METFKMILSTISSGVVKIVLLPGKCPVFFDASGQQLKADFQLLDANYLLKVFGILQGLPSASAPPSKEPWVGSLSLGGGTAVKTLVGNDQLFQIRLYVSPQADSFFEQDLLAMKQTGVATDKKATSGHHASSEKGGTTHLLRHIEANPMPPRQDGVEIAWTKDKSVEIERTQENPIDRILAEMVKIRASDLHLTMGEPIVFRIDGDITRYGDSPISSDVMRSLIDPMIPLANRKEFMEGNDTDFAYEVPQLGRFRVNLFRERVGVCSVIRHIPSKIVPADVLNLPKAVMDFCELTKGLVLVTGPTGSGKSTTLAAMLDYINRTREEHILTIEDPVEFVHPQQKCLVNQREVHKHTKSFSRALRAALREDPDIVLIGEMRDLETIAIAIETAETGHLVFGTLHTNSAVSTVDRIIDQFPADRQNQIRTMLASSLKGVVCQLLLKKKGGGRVAALEVLVSDDALANMIREGKIHHITNHMQTSKAKGNCLMNESLIKHIASGAVDAETAYAKAPDKKSFVAAARGANVRLDGIDVGDAAPPPQPAPGGKLGR